MCVLLAFFFCQAQGHAQGKIRGVVLDVYNKPLAQAKVFIKGEYDFVYTGSEGKFELEVTAPGSYEVVAEHKDFAPVSVQVNVADLQHVFLARVVFKEKVNNYLYLNNIVVRSTRVNETNDKHKSEVLNRLDVLTTAGSNADITSAFKTLPGTQQAVSEDGLFVRGGTGRETKAYIDGTRVDNFYYSGAPDVAHRGRFPPSLFKGSFFSSGGYSAQYGQALSSVIVLETEGLPSKSSLDLNIGTAGINGTANFLGKKQKSSFGGSVNYMNLSPYYGLIPQKYDFSIMPRFLDENLFFRAKAGKKGFFKAFVSNGHSNLALSRQNIDYRYRRDFYSLLNNNTYSNVSYAADLTHKWNMETSFSFGSNEDRFRLGQIDSTEYGRYKDSVVKNYNWQGRLTFKKKLGKQLSLITGGEFEQYGKHYNKKSLSGNAFDRYNYLYSAFFAELSMKADQRFSFRAGLREEQSNRLYKIAISPRAMIDYHLGKDFHLSLHYGQFHQSPEEDLLYSGGPLRFQKATHYIAGFQKVKTNLYTFRVEAFYKKYQYLTVISPDTTQEGFGYAKGVEFFWRQKVSEKSFEYWVSYSFLDARRKFQDYPVSAQPSFASSHAISVVLKRYFDKISTHVAVSYSYESGKPYYNPQKGMEGFLTDRAPDFQNVNLSVAYVRNIGKVYSIFVFTMSNAFNQRQIFGYRYSGVDLNRREASTPLAPRFFYLGAFFNLGVDRTRDAFDRSL